MVDKSKLKIAVVGATGLVGCTMLRVLEERGFGDAHVIAVASPHSVGRRISYAGRELTVVGMQEAIDAHPDYALFSAGAGVSRQYAPAFAANHTVVIDNSSAWRKVDDIPLVVPEVNLDAIGVDDYIVANPNCSTIQMVLALSGLHARYGIRRLVVSTYQSVTGSGQRGISQLEQEEQTGDSKVGERCYPHGIHRNVWPIGGDMCADDYTTEEHKLVDETRKILRDPSIAITATVARVPVVGGHSEAVNVELRHDFAIDDVRQIVATTPGVKYLDDAERQQYPMPTLTQGCDEVYVGRVRSDSSQANALNMWIVADNLRKGAATNAVQIMQGLIERANN